MNGLTEMVQIAAKDIGATILRRFIFLGVIGALSLVACAFAVAAGWAILDDHFGGITASLILAAMFAGVAVIALIIDGLGHRRKIEKQRALAECQQPALGPLLIQTFIASLHAGQSMNTRR